MTFEIIFVLLALVGMVIALILDKMRPGMVLFSVVVLFLCAGILTPKEMLEGFSNKGMITVAMLFLVSEGIRQSGALGQLIKKLLPQGKTTVFKAQLRMLPIISFISAFLNNTPVVVIFAPIIKRWAESVKLPATKFLIPLSYVTILGGICTLIGTSTNLVVHGMILEAGYEGFTMFELGKVGIFVAVVGILYLFLFSSKLLPDVRKDAVKLDDEPEEHSDLHRVEAVLGARFPGINKKLKDFNFKRHYGAEVKEIKRNGQSYTQDLENEYFREGDTLVVMADDSFVQTWGESSVFVIRSGINNNLGFTEADRIENIRRIAEVSKLFVDTGIITIAAFISPSNDIREMAANIIGKDDFLEVYVSTPIEECERRDVKGLYAKARRGEIKNFTGISAPFEAPAQPALVLDTSALSLEESVNKLLELILPRIQKK